MDAEQETRRAKLAKMELHLIQEFLDQERSRLFQIFTSPVASEDLHEVQTQARALTSLEDFLVDLVNTGRLANAKKEQQYD